MPRQMTPEERAAYQREYRARKKSQETGTADFVSATPGVVVTVGPIPHSPVQCKAARCECWCEECAEGRHVRTETGGKSAETVSVEPKTRKNVQKAVETAEIPKNDLESTLRRNRASGNSRWINPFTDGLDDTPVLIARMSQKARDQILDGIPKTARR